MIHVLPWPRGASRQSVPEGDGDVAFVAASAHVPEGVLERLAACARREPAVATVSPFGNRGRLATYPRFAQASELPAGHDAASLDRLFAATNAGAIVDLPLAEPGCVLVTRAALPLLAATGSFEAFCAAASAAGLRHLLAADAFVRRDGPDAAGALDAAQEAAVAEFKDRAPARPYRRRVDLARLRASVRPRLLLVTHQWGGGVERHVNDIARLAADECEVLRLRPDGDGVVQLQWVNPGEELAAWVERTRWTELVALLRAIGIDRVHLHHVHGLPREVLDLPEALGAAHDVTLHDYFPACPRYHLSPREGVSCADDASCVRCDEAGPDAWGLGVAGWRAAFDRFLRRADRVIAPSHDVATRMQGHFPGLPITVWPHPEAPLAIPRVAKVMLLGGIAPLKGARVLEACVADARERALPLHFHVAGHVDRPMEVFPRAPLTVGGSYDEAALGRVVALERPDAFLFLSQVPETFSYTLSAAMATGKPIVATAVGAFAERLREYPRARLVPREADAAQVNAALLEATAA